MNPDRRPLGLTFSELAADQTLPAGQRPHSLPEQRPPFLEPDTGLPVPGPPTAGN